MAGLGTAHRWVELDASGRQAYLKNMKHCPATVKQDTKLRHTNCTHYNNSIIMLSSVLPNAVPVNGGVPMLWSK